MLIRILFVLFLMPIIAGCPPEQWLDVYNNSGSQIVIVSHSNRHDLRHGSAIEANFSDLYFDYVEDEDGTLTPVFRVEANSETYDYEFIVPSAWEDGRILSIIQIEPNFSILYAPESSARPIDEIDQPAGMPIFPSMLAGKQREP